MSLIPGGAARTNNYLKHRKCRRDAGLRKCKGHDDSEPATEAAFVRARRSVGESASTCAGMPVHDMIENMEVHNWTERHEKELTFARNKRRRRLVQAACDELLTFGERTNDLTQQARDATEAQKAWRVLFVLR